MCALKEIELFSEFKDDVFNKCSWIVEKDLKMFAKIYFKHVTTEYVKVLIGLRSPQIFPEIKEYALKFPNGFKEILMKYFKIMYEKRKIISNEFEILVEMFISLNFGFVFSKASFDEEFISVSTEKYIEESIKIFAKGITL